VTGVLSLDDDEEGDFWGGSAAVGIPCARNIRHLHLLPPGNLTIVKRADHPHKHSLFRVSPPDSHQKKSLRFATAIGPPHTFDKPNCILCPNMYPTYTRFQLKDWIMGNSIPSHIQQEQKGPLLNSSIPRHSQDEYKLLKWYLQTAHK
jgi:hypothetical protein